MSDTTDTIVQEEIKVNPEESTGNGSAGSGNVDDLESDIKAFAESTTEHKVEPETTVEKKDEPIEESELNSMEEFKFQMFFGLFFSLVDELHYYVYKFATKVDIKKEEFCLDEAEKQSFEIYFKTKRVMNLINKLPSELIGIMHLEWLYFQRFKELKEEQQAKEVLLEKKEPVKKQVKNKPVKKAAGKKKSVLKKHAA